MKKYRTKYNDDGTVTYWSVYRQEWIYRERRVPPLELVAMSPEERKQVIDHTETHQERDRQ